MTRITKKKLAEDHERALELDKVYTYCKVWGIEHPEEINDNWDEEERYYRTHPYDIPFYLDDSKSSYSVINGCLTSIPQLKLASLLGVLDSQINFRVKSANKYYSLDIAYPALKIGIEYDCWKWHGLERDIKKNRDLLVLEWKLLRIKSANKLPSLLDTQEKLLLLVCGSTYEEIILDDWKG